jgi:hypothetical protein
MGTLLCDLYQLTSARRPSPRRQPAHEQLEDRRLDMPSRR